MDGQGTKWRRNVAENFNQLSTVHERYRQTDDRRTGDSIGEREREFTFAKNYNCVGNWATMWHRLHNRLNPCTQIIRFFTPWKFFVLRMRVLASWFVWGVGSQVIVLGVEMSEKNAENPTWLGAFAGFGQFSSLGSPGGTDRPLILEFCGGAYEKFASGRFRRSYATAVNSSFPAPPGFH